MAGARLDTAAIGSPCHSGTGVPPVGVVGIQDDTGETPVPLWRPYPDTPVWQLQVRALLVAHASLLRQESRVFLGLVQPQASLRNKATSQERRWRKQGRMRHQSSGHGLKRRGPVRRAIYLNGHGAEPAWVPLRLRNWGD